MTRWLSNFDRQKELFKTLPLNELKSTALFWRVGAYCLAGIDAVTAEGRSVREMVSAIKAAKGFSGDQKEEQERALIMSSFVPRTRLIIEKKYKEISTVK